MLVPLFLIVLIVWSSIARQRRNLERDRILATLPLSALNPQQTGRFMLVQYRAAGMAYKYRQALGIPDAMQETPSTAPVETAGIISAEEHERANQPRRL